MSSAKEARKILLDLLLGPNTINDKLVRVYRAFETARICDELQDTITRLQLTLNREWERLGDYSDLYVKQTNKEGEQNDR